MRYKEAMPLPPEIGLADLQKMLDMLTGTMEGATQLARRVSALEKATNEIATGLVTVKDFVKSSTAQQLKLNAQMSDAVMKLSALMVDRQG
jgi:hypothetical protein